MSAEKKTCKASEPCATCPWRRNKDASDIPGFDIEKAEGLADTIGTSGQEVAYGKAMMACHGSAEGEETVCRGWAHQAGYFHLGARITAVADGWPRDIFDERDDLHTSWDEVIEKLRRTA